MNRPIRNSYCEGVLFTAVLLLTVAFSRPVQAQKWKFVVTCDSNYSGTGTQINTNILAELAQAFTNEKPAFVLYGGDFAARGNLANYVIWSNIMAPVYAAGIAVYTVAGNHDTGSLGSIDDYSSFFGRAMPANGPLGELGLTYSVTWSNAFILMLHVFNLTNFYRVDQAWVDTVLATNSQPHVFALSHVPAFHSYHSDCLDDYPADRDRFWNSLSNAHARVYFSGHDHFYDHARLDDQDGNPDNDLHQIIVGTAGSAFYPDTPYDGTNGLWTPLRLLHEANYGYVRVEIDGPRARTTWLRRAAPGLYEPGGDVFEWTVPQPLRLAAHYETNTLVLTWSEPAILESAGSADGLFTNVPGATSPHVATNAPGSASFFRLRAAPLLP